MRWGCGMAERERPAAVDSERMDPMEFPALKAWAVKVWRRHLQEQAAKGEAA